MSYLHFAKPVGEVTRSLRVGVIARRMFSENCKDEDPKNKCTKKSFVEKPCNATYPASCAIKGKMPKPQYEYTFKSMWYEPMCCENVCDPNFKPFRHDVEFQNNMKVMQRCYQRTWPQCPDRFCRRKPCIQQKIKVAIPEIRPRGVGNPAAKWITKLSNCAKVDKYEKPCEACKPRKPCKYGQSMGCCKRRCTLYPSYSECCHRLGKPKRPDECSTPPTGLCSMVQYLEARGLLNKNVKAN